MLQPRERERTSRKKERKEKREKITTLQRKEEEERQAHHTTHRPQKQQERMLAADCKNTHTNAISGALQPAARQRGVALALFFGGRGPGPELSAL